MDMHLYGYAFIEKEVLKEYLLYDSDDDFFIEDNIGCIESHYNGPDYFVMDSVWSDNKIGFI